MKPLTYDASAFGVLALPSDDVVRASVDRVRRLRQKTLATHAVDFLAVRATGMLAIRFGTDAPARDPWSLAA